MKSDLEQVIAELEIRKVLGKYCRSFDRMDRDLAYSIWHPDGTAQYIERPVMPARAFIDQILEMLRTRFARSHQITNMVIEIEGDRAVSEAYGVACLLDIVDGQIVSQNFHGRYFDSWSRRDGRWAIDHRRYVSDCFMTSSCPVEKFSLSALQLGKPGKDDPSYALFASLKKQGA
jgi:hypothetical protein